MAFVLRIMFIQFREFLFHSIFHYLLREFKLFWFEKSQGDNNFSSEEEPEFGIGVRGSACIPVAESYPIQRKF